MAVNSFWPKLIVSGNRAEQPSPASAKVRTPSNELIFGTHALAKKAAASCSLNFSALDHLFAVAVSPTATE
jgi:hypothetical protein